MNDGFCSNSYALLDDKVWMTIFTPTYNRREQLPRLYDSLKQLISKSDKYGERIIWDWIIVDDGSEDDTRSLIESWIKEDELPIVYYYQENAGKHTAFNFAVEKARGETFLCIDSDDTLFPDALVTFYDTWQSIPDAEREKLKGVTARAIDPATGKLAGTPLPHSPLIANAQDIRFRYRVKGEMCGFNRTDILRQFPFPVAEKMSFMPESIVWYTIGKEYDEVFIDNPVREYFDDAANSVTKGYHDRRAHQNYYLWSFEVKNLSKKYFLTSPKEMIKPFVGMTMDGLRTKRSFGQILNDSGSIWNKILVVALSPVGFVLSRRK